MSKTAELAEVQPEPETIDAKRAAKLLGYSASHTLKLARIGVLPHLRLGVRGDIRFRPSSLRRIVAEAETIAS